MWQCCRYSNMALRLAASSERHRSVVCSTTVNTCANSMHHVQVPCPATKHVRAYKTAARSETGQCTGNCGLT